MLKTASTVSPERVANWPVYRTCCGTTGAWTLVPCSGSCSEVCACADAPMARGIQISVAARARREISADAPLLKTQVTPVCFTRFSLLCPRKVRVTSRAQAGEIYKAEDA